MLAFDRNATFAAAAPLAAFLAQLVAVLVPPAHRICLHFDTPTAPLIAALLQALDAQFPVQLRSTRTCPNTTDLIVHATADRPPRLQANVIELLRNNSLAPRIVVVTRAALLVASTDQHDGPPADPWQPFRDQHVGGVAAILVGDGHDDPVRLLVGVWHDVDAASEGDDRRPSLVSTAALLRRPARHLLSVETSPLPLARTLGVRAIFHQLFATLPDVLVVEAPAGGGGGADARERRVCGFRLQFLQLLGDRLHVRVLLVSNGTIDSRAVLALRSVADRWLFHRIAVRPHVLEEGWVWWDSQNGLSCLFTGLGPSGIA